MTGVGRYEVQTGDMDLIELTRTIQAEKERDIETAGRNLRLLARDASPERQGWRQRWFGSSRTAQRPVSSGTASR
jgi:hypothetical protein